MHETDHKLMMNSLKQVGKKHWEFWFNFLLRGCMHGAQCSRRAKEGSCEFGSRLYNKHIITGERGMCRLKSPLNFRVPLLKITGAVLPVMKEIFEVVGSRHTGDEKKKAPRALRAKTEDGDLVVGLSLVARDAEAVLMKLDAL